MPDQVDLNEVYISNIQVPPTTTMPLHYADVNPHPQYLRVDGVADFITSNIAMSNLKDVDINGAQTNNTLLIFSGGSYKPITIDEFTSKQHIPYATSEVAGIIEVATNSDLDTTNNVAVTPSLMQGYVDTQIDEIHTSLNQLNNSFGNLPYATTTESGVVFFATDQEATGGVVTNKAVTPAGVKAAINNIQYATTNAPGVIKTIETDNSNGKKFIADLITSNATSTYAGVITQYVPQIQYNQFVNVRTAKYLEWNTSLIYYSTHVGPISEDTSAEALARANNYQVGYLVYSNGVLSGRNKIGNDDYEKVYITAEEQGAIYDINTHGNITVRQEGIAKRLIVGETCYATISGEAHNVLVSGSEIRTGTALPAGGLGKTLIIESHGHVTYCTIAGTGVVSVCPCWDTGGTNLTNTVKNATLNVFGITPEVINGKHPYNFKDDLHATTAQITSLFTEVTSFYDFSITSRESRYIKSLDDMIQYLNWKLSDDDGVIENVVVSDTSSYDDENGNFYAGLYVTPRGKAYNVVLTGSKAGAIIEGYAKDVVVHSKCCVWTKAGTTRIDNLILYNGAEIKLHSGVEITGCIAYPGAVMTGAADASVTFNTCHEPDHVVEPLYSTCQYWDDDGETNHNSANYYYCSPKYWLNSTSHYIHNVPYRVAPLVGPKTYTNDHITSYSYTPTLDTVSDANKKYYTLNGNNYILHTGEFEENVTYYEYISTVTITEPHQVDAFRVTVYATTTPRFFVRSDTDLITSASAAKKAGRYTEYTRLNESAVTCYPATILRVGDPTMDGQTGYQIVPDFGPDAYHEMWTLSGDGNALVKKYVTTNSTQGNIYTSAVNIGNDQTSLVIVGAGPGVDPSTYTSHFVGTINVELGKYGTFDTVGSGKNTFYKQIISKMFDELEPIYTSEVVVNDTTGDTSSVIVDFTSATSAKPKNVVWKISF